MDTLLNIDVRTRLNMLSVKRNVKNNSFVAIKIIVGMFVLLHAIFVMLGFN